MEILMEKIAWAWNDLDLVIVAGIFVAYFVYDVLYAYYMISVTDLKPGHAASFGSVLYIIGAVGVLSYVENFLYTVPIVIGGWLGTYVAVRMEKRKKEKIRELKKIPPFK